MVNELDEVRKKHDMSVSEIQGEVNCVDIDSVNWGELLREVEDALTEYDSQTEWRQPFDYALGIKNGLLNLGILPPEDMPEKVFEMLRWREDDYFADMVNEKWEKVYVPFGLTQSILVSEIKPDYMIRKISPAEVTQNSAQCIMNLCVVLAERDGEFHLPSTFISDWLGIKRQVAAMILKKLQQAGYLVRLGDTFTKNGKKTPLWSIGDGVPIKKEKKPRKKKDRDPVREAEKIYPFVPYNGKS